MSLEDKMKKRQEIQQEINNLNQQLRQHQIEQRNKQQSKNSSSMDDMVAGTSNTSKKKDTGLSQASMQAMISADSSMKQAKVQGSMATQIQGRASVLESEIKQDAGKGNTEKKEEELAELQAKAQSATAAQMSTLADANKSVEEAAKAENSNTEDTATKNNTCLLYTSIDLADTPSYAGVFNSIFCKCKKTPQIAYSCNDYILQGKLISLGLGVSFVASVTWTSSSLPENISLLHIDDCPHFRSIYYQPLGSFCSENQRIFEHQLEEYFKNLNN